VPWQKLKDELNWDDVGGRLLANLAKGIYNHEAILREYVQNARDAYQALDTLPENPRIIVRAEGKNLSIQDDGSGMDEAEIREVKKIAVSNKNDLDSMAGFRGIGIWAGFQACDKLEVVTKKKGHDRKYRLEIDFKDIMSHVDENINIKKLVDPRYRIEWEGGQTKGEHYTRVTLHSIHGDFSQLLDPDELVRIVSQLLPCPLDPKFEHHAELRALLSKIPNYQEFSIKVADKNGSLKDVYRYFPTGIAKPELVVLTNSNGSDLAYAWYCPTTESALKEKGLGLRGFRLRIHNIAVGRINVYDDPSGNAFGISKHLTLKTVNRLPWFCGEIHVSSDEIRPNTPRSELEIDSVSKSLIDEIRGFYKKRIEEAGALSDFNGHNNALQEAEDLIGKWKAAPPTNDSSLAEERQDLLKRLEEDANTTKIKNATGSKKLLKILLNKKEVRTRSKTVIEELKALKVVGGGTTKGKEEPKPKATSTGPAAGTAKSGQLVTLDAEDFLSDVVAILEGAFGEDNEAIAKVVEQISDLLKAQATKNAA
jgi:hypothetical protein